MSLHGPHADVSAVSSHACKLVCVRDMEMGRGLHGSMCAGMCLQDRLEKGEGLWEKGALQGT